MEVWNHSNFPFLIASIPIQPKLNILSMLLLYFLQWHWIWCLSLEDDVWHILLYLFICSGRDPSTSKKFLVWNKTFLTFNSFKKIIIIYLNPAELEDIFFSLQDWLKANQQFVLDEDKILSIRQGILLG